MRKIAVVILNWNGVKHLENYLPSVVEHSKDAEVYVVDNYSTDDSISFLEQKFPQVKIVPLEKNHGFAGGYNRGLHQIKADYYVLLNSDVEVTQNWIDPVIEYMTTNDVIAAQPKIKDWRKKEWFEYAGASGGYIDRKGFIFCAGRIFDSFEKDQNQYDQSREVFWASGASLFIKADAYHEVEGFDEDFFAHMEEIDLCWRLKNRGYKIGYCHESEVYHLGGGTLNNLNPRKTYLNFRNNLFLLQKNYHFGGLFILIFSRLVLDGVAAIRFLTEGKAKFFTAVFKAHMSFYAAFFSTQKKRSFEKSKLSNPNRAGWFKGIIIKEYFLNKKKTFLDLDPTDFRQK